MPGQIPFGYNNQNMTNYNPFDMYINKLNELEQRINILEKKVKELNNNNYNNSFDYKTSMHMM